ncbi:hypothetical protein [Nostoc sp. T09]|uniref:hypothetical protein n=1 Tax=Nostoc sp. T09 TaxID=1932621 RepID=UPI00117D7639|nr:hypothetical protein [Nostoc sp. T09]
MTNRLLCERLPPTRSVSQRRRSETALREDFPPQATGVSAALATKERHPKGGHRGREAKKFIFPNLRVC